MYDDYNDQYDSYADYGPVADTHTDEYDRDAYRQVPELVRKFLIYFRNCINEGVIFEVQTLYENSFPKLSEQFFDKQSWPDETDVAHIVDNDPVFLVLYKELYYRHIYARIPGGPTLEQRFGSFFNYCDLFNYILSAETPVPLELPDQWLWELIDEFVYQFQCFAQYRARLLKKTPEEIENLNAHNNIWSVLCILNVLHSLVDKSKIKSQLEVYASGGDPDSVAGSFGRHSLYKMLGYFSLVGLLRLHSLLGDYYQAIKVLENVELYKKSAYSHVPACQISTAYYVGFAYMMMRRYADAIRTFSSILLYIQRTKQLFTSRSYQNDQINKQTEQMYHLLAICLVLHPQCIDEVLQQALREKNYHEKMYKMQYGDLAEFEACFLYACPKFLSPCPPPPDAPNEDYVKEAIKHQTQVFMDEVAQQKMLPTIRSYLKLYTTLPLSKLATFMCSSTRPDGSWDLDKEVATLGIYLLCFKHKMKNIVWTKGSSGLDGKFQSGSELDFYIDHDMIHIADTKVAHRYGDFFIRKILKFEELNRKLHKIKI
ncbi:eukaryotic translation initiation factor 3 subunit L [Neodiprion pinetum]|uniref:Eukaryotic translation initiation factor 3 subunit L n=1 Tax=Neodiprion lecontei TaxID=441921 RepID=A0A6J0C3S7_NEOLC|nr:eukaryotic translation initiation factor 3 subunit L [Neodiprion lecontei]XP_046468447.1 eukaryotic translation initiation factor 3 subunit L [Neodiprion pinetum]XP_046603930.1 eukaryotic translation initiation factor 3 subunit L [Neodiprion virginianus]